MPSPGLGLVQGLIGVLINVSKALAMRLDDFIKYISGHVMEKEEVAEPTRALMDKLPVIIALVVILVILYLILSRLYGKQLVKRYEAEKPETDTKTELKFRKKVEPEEEATEETKKRTRKVG